MKILLLEGDREFRGYISRARAPTSSNARRPRARVDDPLWRTLAGTVHSARFMADDAP